ncbi:MAG: Asp-tRNA(Asn)/Glu-tRNA(Gln) amidotransferase subunit GatA [Thaumarchaeota archaeon]|nr:Asp-tRNA(Asn)/Glu-tRNA(Gln) amidotransferase subunit GatA [Nitrososphaerota archaeon]
MKMQSAWEISEGVRKGSISAVETVEECFARIEKYDKDVHAFIATSKGFAIQQAKDIEKKRGKKLGRLAGVPIAIKDNICTRGIETTCASKILRGYIPPYDATVVKLLKEEGAIIVGKTNLDEFGMGSTTEFSAFFATKNPRNLDYVPGGSSGGSVAAVAKGLSAVALGTDTGGSIRCPSAFCGVVGVKPTYGLVSRYGLIAYANTLEQIGPIANNVSDAALLLSCIAGHDSNDSTSIGESKDYTKFSNDSKLKIGVPKQYFGEGTQKAVSDAVWSAIKKLEGEGAEVEEVDLKSVEYALASYYIIAMSEASSNLARYDGLRYGFQDSSGARDWSTLFSKDRKAGFGFEVKKRIMLGTFALSAGYFDAYYVKAQKVRNLIIQDFHNTFKKFDVLIGPTMPTTAFKLGEKTVDPLAMYMSDCNTVPANLAGIPAISVPCGSSNGLPIGLQIMAAPLEEGKMLNAAKTLEDILGVYAE